MQTKSILALATVVSQAYAYPLEGLLTRVLPRGIIQAREVIAHDAVQPFADTVQSGATGDLIKKFEPFLHIAHGCQSYPAVDAEGNTR